MLTKRLRTRAAGQQRKAIRRIPPCGCERRHDGGGLFLLACATSQAVRRAVSAEFPAPPRCVTFRDVYGEQRAGILNRLLSAAGPGLLTSGALGSLSGLLGGGGQPNVTPEKAQQVPPEAVQQLADHAQNQSPSIVDEASQFYAQHPMLVKSLGAGALVLILSHLSQHT